MKKKDVKKLLKKRPDFEQWLLEDPERIRLVRKKPSETKGLLTKWESAKNKKGFVPQVDFRRLSDKTKKVNEKLNKMQGILELMAEQSKRRNLL
ncbi:hypothetical protein [Brevibacillus dissolubilis]|uniref:hypothetical protein n=1 Tax=Brevibacillus dissolubilis TaxID=1844116 RepID=UPI00111676E1|nr:hypothetical protein [Brevibacillus dissolubilis]